MNSMEYILTVEGERYISRINAQMMQMHVVRIDVGSGTVNNPELLTDLTNRKQTIQIESIDQYLNTSVLHCLITNLDVHEGYLLQQAGVFAYDAVDNRVVMILIGQDQAGEKIPAIEEREVQYLHNIGIQVSSTREIIFDKSLNDFISKEYLEYALKRKGRILTGPVNTVIGLYDILLVSDGVTRAYIDSGTGKVIYYGASPKTFIQEAEVTQLTRENVRNRSFSFTQIANTGNYIYLAIPASFGAPQFTVDGWTGGFFLSGSAKLSESYNIYRSDNSGIGITTVNVVVEMGG